MNTIPLSLYIHVPWCVRKCPYCDFNSHQQRGELPEQAYVECLLEDLQTQLDDTQGRPIHSIFIGGGTPSLFSPEAYEALFKGLHKNLIIPEDTEITMEANPGTVEAEHFTGYREVGINRLSLGVQSLQDDKLKRLGRIHSADEALKAIKIAKEAGFNNFNVDLMFGLPNQTTNDALYDLETALHTEPTHLSWYQLTLEPQTSFYKHPPPLPSDDNIWEIQEAGQALLKQRGFEQYEISAYATPEKQCQHNLNYWQFGDYLAIGAGAHGKITLPNGRIKRFNNIKSPKFYLDTNKKFRADEKLIPQNDLPLEFFMNAFRLQQSVSEALLQQRTGLLFNNIKTPLNTAEERGLLIQQNNSITLTPIGHRYLNELLELFC